MFRASNDGVSNIWIMNADGSGLGQVTDDPAGNFDVWLMNADGSDPINLTDHPATDDYPSWTSDGLGLTFTSNRLSDRVWLMKADGSSQTLFTTVGLSRHGTSIGPLA